MAEDSTENIGSQPTEGGSVGTQGDNQTLPADQPNPDVQAPANIVETHGAPTPDVFRRSNPKRENE